MPLTLARLAPPPRRVGFAAGVRARFGGTLVQSGWGLIALGLLGGSWFAGDSELVTALTFVGSKHVTTGTVISAGETGAERAEPILEVHYRYAVDGVEHEGESYSLSATFAPGETVRVEYLDALPSSSRIVGLRKRRFGTITSFVFGFVVLGIGLLWMRRVQLRDHPRLLREGRVASATLIHRAIGLEVDGERVDELTFRFDVDRAGEHAGYRGAARERDEHELVLRTERADEIAAAPSHSVLFDPSRPSRALLVQELPQSVRISSDGGFDAPPGDAALLLVLPTASVVGLLLMVAFALS